MLRRRATDLAISVNSSWQVEHSSWSTESWKQSTPFSCACLPLSTFSSSFLSLFLPPLCLPLLHFPQTPWLCCAARLTSRRGIGCSPARGALPRSSPPTHPPTPGSGNVSGADGGGEAGLKVRPGAGCDSRQLSASQLAPEPTPAPARS